MKRIIEDNKIFKSEEYQKDSAKFFLIEKNFGSPDLILYSDEENYVSCRGKVGLPTWIWTKDNFDHSKLKEIEEVMSLYLTGEEDRFTCKEELYNLLASDNYPYLASDEKFEMGFLSCKELVDPKKVDGKMIKATEDYYDILVEYVYDSTREMRDVDNKTIEEAKKTVENELEAGNIYLWLNDEGVPVSMAYYGVIDNKAKISGVYTPKEYRNKGYAANIIYGITKIILEDGLLPMLYTDYSYKPSNIAYQNVGFTDEGVLINFKCKKR